MNARVFVLLLVSAAFMAVWNDDQTHSTQILLSKDRVRANALTMVPARQEAASGASSEETVTDTLETIASDTPKTSVQPVIPLPVNLQPGTWHAISHDGDTFRITIERTNGEHDSANSKSEGSAVTESKFCIITGPGNVRWCFIKQQIKATLEANRSGNEYQSPVHE